MATPDNDRNLEHRREHVITHLWLDLGRKPTEDEVQDHLAEMDARNAGMGAHHVGTVLDNEARVRAEKKRQEQKAAEDKDEAERAQAQKMLEREERARQREQEQLRALEERESQISSETKPEEISGLQITDDTEQRRAEREAERDRAAAEQLANEQQ